MKPKIVIKDWVVLTLLLIALSTAITAFFLRKPSTLVSTSAASKIDLEGATPAVVTAEPKTDLNAIKKRFMDLNIGIADVIVTSSKSLDLEIVFQQDIALVDLVAALRIVDFAVGADAINGNRYSTLAISRKGQEGGSWRSLFERDFINKMERKTVSQEAARRSLLEQLKFVIPEQNSAVTLMIKDIQIDGAQKQYAILKVDKQMTDFGAWLEAQKLTPEQLAPGRDVIVENLSSMDFTKVNADPSTDLLFVEIIVYTKPDAEPLFYVKKSFEPGGIQDISSNDTRLYPHISPRQ
jgi:hypothetical protein